MEFRDLLFFIFVKTKIVYLGSFVCLRADRQTFVVSLSILLLILLQTIIAQNNTLMIPRKA